MVLSLRLSANGIVRSPLFFILVNKVFGWNGESVAGFAHHILRLGPPEGVDAGTGTVDAECTATASVLHFKERFFTVLIVGLKLSA